ncbi:MAG: hypothetical protein QF718_01635 [Phycisphaerales bacterium]|jgi:hypothetical protein|nr:hypothetical protein [Phycisphaerales bacterium]
MASQNKLITLVVLACVGLLFVGGCGSEPEEQPPPVVKQPKPKPKPKSIDQLSHELMIDNRIVLSEEESPKKEAARIAILKFFDAMLDSDPTRLGSMLSFGDKLELGVMMDAGLRQVMDQVSMVELKTGSSPESRECVMGVFEIGLNYQIQLWYYKQENGAYIFEAVETPPNLVNKLSGNWITSYFMLKAKQIEIAQQPDEETSYTLAGETTTSDGGLGDGGGGPKGPGGPSGPRSPGGPRGPGR